MGTGLAFLRQFSLISVCCRLLIAQAAGAIIGYGRAQKKANAGLRTYMLVSIGAALTMVLATYEHEMLLGPWAWAVEKVGMKFDASRFSASVVTGVGFLAAGTIIVVAHRQVSGLTSAVGLFTTAVMGIAAGAGFYECVLVALGLIVFTIEFMQPMELAFKRRLRYITLFVEFGELSDLDRIIQTIKGEHAAIFDLDMEHTEAHSGKNPSAILTLKLSRENASHSAILSSLAELPCVYGVQELIQ